MVACGKCPVPYDIVVEKIRFDEPEHGQTIETPVRICKALNCGILDVIELENDNKK
ncbi:hypothetical protein AALB52_13530 [Lachnospiraceae bacterium 38-14]|uniref:hypothetical protein n=1 Tax=Roseburia sp. 1XD42-69 TaxID=2320088 RepID=UPI001FA94D05|nr:hypothetical protein [Roseburia sp. 1XD42-69]